MAERANTPSIPDDALADDLPLVHVFGENARVKIIAAMLTEVGRDLNVSDIARLAGVARSTVYDHLEELEHMGVVIHTRKVGPALMYELDMESGIVKRIDEIQGLATRRLFQEGETEDQ